MPSETVPEIKRTNLSNTVLYLKTLGLRDVLGFGFLDPPSLDQLCEALVEQHMLGALDNDGYVTSVGRGMSRFPVEPSVARMLVAAAESGEADVVEDVVAIAAMLSVEKIWVERPLSGVKRDRDHDATSHMVKMIESTQSSLKDERGDHFTLLKIFRMWISSGRTKDWCETHFIKFRALKNAQNIYNQLLPDALACTTKPSTNKSLSLRSRGELVRSAILHGLFMNAARRCSPESLVYRCCDIAIPGASDGVRLMHLHPDSSLVVAHDADHVVYQVVS